MALPLVGLIALAGLPRAIFAGESVAVSATATGDYKRAVPGQRELRPETYVFMAGRHFSGSSKDASEEKTPFLKLATTLATGLVRQNYFPAKDPALADLMIVVHWGATQVYDDPDKQFTAERLNSAIAAYSAAIAETGTANTGELSMALSARSAGTSSQAQTMAVNAGLLGYEQSLLKERSMMASADEIIMRAELGEERYFVILMAYDYQALKKEKKRRLLWVTRMSVRSPGNNFATAIPAMTQVAADFFGRQEEGLAHVTSKPRDARVNVGLPTVVPAEPGSKADASTR